MRKLLSLLFITSALSALADSSYITPISEDSISRLNPEDARMARLKNEQRILFLGSGEQASADSVSQTVALFYYDQFRHFQDPTAPYFMLMSKDAKLAMGIGGSVRMRGWYDFGGSMPVNGFVPAMIPVPSNPDKRRRIGGTPGGTALFFKVLGRSSFGNITGYIQCDFSGDRNVTFTLKKAYAVINDWTIGYASTTFSDPAAETPTIDGAGQNGRVSSSRMLVRWAHDFNKRWSMAASVELPSSHVDADGILTKKLDDYLPDIVAYGQLNLPYGSHIRVSGTLRFIPYRNLVNQTDHTVVGWGAQLSGVWYVNPSLGIFGEFNTGHGYASFMGDLSIGNYEIVADRGEPGRLYAPLAMGLNAGVRYNFSSKFYANVALGKACYYPKDKADPDNYRYGLYGAVNLFYEPTSRLQVGIEYLRGSRHNFSGESASANRIDALFQFAF